MKQLLGKSCDDIRRETGALEKLQFLFGVGDLLGCSDLGIAIVG